MAVNIGPRIGIEGEKEYRAQINNIIQSQKTLAAEMNVVASEFDKAENKQEKLTKQSDIYNKMIKDQARHLDMLKDKLKAATDKWGESDAKTQKWKEAIANSKLKLDEYNKSLEKMKRDLANINFDKAIERLDKFSSTVDRAVERTKGLSAASAIALVAMSKQASDYVENVNKTKEAFKGASEEVLKFSKTSLENFGVDKSQALETASLFGDMATSMGLATNEAAKMSVKLVELGGDLSSFKNLSMGEVTTALNGIFTGETESLKRLGVVMTETNLKAFALSQGIQKQYKDMSQAEKVTLRYNYVLEMTKNAQGDFARTRNETANSARVLKGQIKELSIELGTALLPTVKQLLNEAVKLAQNFNKLDDNTKKTIVTVIALTAAIYPLGKGISGITSAASAAAKGLDALSSAMNISKGAAVATAGKIGLVVAAIGGVMYAIKKYDEYQFKNTDTAKFLEENKRDWDAVRDSIKSAAAELEKNKEILNGRNWADTSHIEALGKRYIELNEKTKLTKKESGELKVIAEQLKNEMPELAGNINGVTGAYNGQISTIKTLIQKHILLAQAQALTLKKTDALFAAEQRISDYAVNRKDYDKKFAEKKALEKELFGKIYNEINQKVGFEEKNDPLKMSPYKRQKWLEGMIKGNLSEFGGILSSIKKSDLDRYNAITKELKESGKAVNESFSNKLEAERQFESFNNELDKTSKKMHEIEAQYLGLNKNNKGNGGGGGSGKSRGGSSSKRTKEEKNQDKELLEAAKKRIEFLKASHTINLKQEIDYWKSVQKAVKKGGEEYNEAQLLILRAREEYNNAKIRIDKKYLDSFKKQQKEMVNQIKANQKRYRDALKSQEEALKSQFKLFEKYEKGEQRTPWELTQNLSSQVQGFRNWQADIEKIKNRGVTDEMLAEIKKLGIGAAEEIKAMTEMTDSELLNYVTVWQEFQKEMTNTAEKELEPFREATEEANRELISKLEKGVKKANKTYKKGLKELGTSGANAAKRAGKLTAQALLEGLKSQDEELQRYMLQMRGTIAEAFNINVSVKQKKKKIKQKADGGYVGPGEVFIAGERGAELVGRLNGQTAVANGSQMGYALVKAIEPHLSKLLNYNNNYAGTQAITLYNTTITNLDGKMIDKVVTKRVISNATRLNTAYSGVKGA